MEVFIRVLNVGDGDAVIVKVIDTDRKLVFMIDAGHPYDYEKVSKNLKEVLESVELPAPDFILCTHYDNDHIGGLLKLVKDYETQKPSVWIHATSEKINVKDLTELVNHEPENGIMPSEEDDNLAGENSANIVYYQNVLTTVEQEIALLEYLRPAGFSCKEPLAENFKIDQWPELSILSPTTSFYETLFPEHFSTQELVENHMNVLKGAETDQKISDDPCKKLDLKKSPITATNMNSAILMLVADGKKIIFSGDAGIESFEAIPDYKNVLDQLYFLKVPHHGSRNNINQELIQLMKPRIAVISGRHHVSGDVLACLKATCEEVSVTKDGQDIDVTIP
ncbi:ComEC/Rec2 family competence protein [Mucilaginibacter terrae]|uniref:Beta-lactamase superfamily II metal-dependent hydrolase n=1 Tax=Mucilaginibacter terrae TaxID=1955052 RepID=A0ABU3H037_9SPHI|nr:MBL fold metallo-hydrolase [Mucilaginibacter terrae]MDT3404270.1 beta-lactamase superfamily II metal-dependent hydrolase [Mucilaginibacter terrae]